MYAKENSGRKLLVLLVALMLAIGIAIGGTVAWLITSTDPVVNTFTSGDIDIVLQEHVLNLQTGEHADPEAYTDKDQSGIELLPGRTIYKDPTVTVLEGSEPCYVRMFLIFQWTDAADSEFIGDEAKNWFVFPTTGDELWIPGESYIDNYSNLTLHNIYEFQYSKEVDASSGDRKLTPLFTQINIPGIKDPEEPMDQEWYASLKDCKVTVIAQAVQSANFDDAEAAFDQAGRPEFVQELVDDFNARKPADPQENS